MGMKLDDVLWQDAERVSGAVCFRDSRLPVELLFVNLLAGHSLEEFIEAYQADRDQVTAVLAECREMVLARYPEATRFCQSPDLDES